MNFKNIKKSLKLTSILFSCILIAYLLIHQLIFNVPVFAFHGLVDKKNPKYLPSRANYLDYTIQDLEIFLEKLIQDDYWFLSSQEIYFN
jgi:hypothetical protein